MSLLMDALKKAEKTKQGSGGVPGKGDGGNITPSGPATVWPELSIDPQPADLATELGLDTPARKPAAAARAIPPSAAARPALEIGLEPMPASGRASHESAEPVRSSIGSATPSQPPPAPPARGTAGSDTGKGATQTALAADRLAAKSMFAAKRQPASASRAPFFGIVGMLLLAGAGAAYYFWSQLQAVPQAPPPKGPGAAGGRIGAPPAAAAQPMARNDTPTSPPSPPAAALPPTTEMASAPALPPQVSGSPAPAANPVASATPAPAPQPPTARAGPTAIEPAVPADAREARRPDVPAPRGNNVATARGGTPVQSPANMRISRERANSGVDPGVTSGYAALAEGNIEAAREGYARALNADSGNRDALLGMAAVAQRSGRSDAAEGFYRRVLELYPRDPYATTQLTALRSGGDAAAAESRVKSLLAEAKAPAGAAPLHYALGNQMAAQGRWAEAQQAYFNAYTAEPENPDYCYNLAVSLDQIHQPRLAQQHYARALELAQTRRAGFDTARAKARLDQLANAAR